MRKKNRTKEIRQARQYFVTKRRQKEKLRKEKKENAMNQREDLLKYFKKQTIDTNLQQKLVGTKRKVQSKSTEDEDAGYQDLIKQRSELPIIGFETEIIESIRANDVVIICGETGSGKTTQVPRFLYENGFCSDGMTIGVTQPRRVAAVSTAVRVAKEMGFPSIDSEDSFVGYQIRYDKALKSSSDSVDTKIKFMTDGILLREVSSDPKLLLLQYSCIVIDEAHERGVNTDILIGLLSRIVLKRRKLFLQNKQTGVKPLKVIIMSATLRISDFTQNKKLFRKEPPVIKVHGKQYKVKIHWPKETAIDYVRGMVEKVARIHKDLPKGTILCFLSGKQEIIQACEELEEKFGIGGYSPAKILPLYSSLPKEEQQKVFEDSEQVRNGEIRVIVISTNVAETSLTIPNVRYVVDSGKEKIRCYDLNTGVSTFKVVWISKASAIQRSGRAGRVMEGHAYRLYHSAIFEDSFKEFAKPEILRVPLDEIVLQMKKMRIPEISKFPLPTAPDPVRLSETLELLCQTGALVQKGEKYYITPTGKMLAKYPVQVRFSRMLHLAKTQASNYVSIIGSKRVIKHELLRITMLVVGLLTTTTSGIYKKNIRSDGNSIIVSDVLALAKEYLDVIFGESRKKSRFRSHILFEIRNLLNQLGYIVSEIEFPDNEQARKKMQKDLSDMSALRMKYKPIFENSLKLELFRQTILGGFLDHIAKKWPAELPMPLLDADNQEHAERKYRPGAYQSINTGVPVYIHPSSLLFSAGIQPEYLCYKEIIATETARVITEDELKAKETDETIKELLEDKISYRSEVEKMEKERDIDFKQAKKIEIKKSKDYMRGCTSIKKEWLYNLGPQFCSFGKIISHYYSTIYDKSTDQLKSKVATYYGNASSSDKWFLGKLSVPVQTESSREKYHLFAVLLLEGRIIPDFKKLQLKYKPEHFYGLTKHSAAAKLNQEIVDLLQQQQVLSRARLFQIWKMEEPSHGDPIQGPNYLRKQMQACYRDSVKKFNNCWDSLVKKRR